MTTLTKIRNNKKKNDSYKLYFETNYINPNPISYISKIIKKENIKIINEACNGNNLDEKQKDNLMKKFIKPNFYTPYIVNSESKELLQQLI